MTLALASDRSLVNAPRGLILMLEAAMREHPEAQTAADYPVQHHFAPGQYGREIFMPAGSVVVGKIHKHAHVNVLSMGRCKVFTETGGLEVLEAPRTWVSAPGTKRTVHVLEDTLWTTFHCNPSNTRDLARLERELIAPDYEALEAAA